MHLQFPNRYKKENKIGAKICATKFCPKGTVLECLTGRTANLDDEELKYLETNGLDFSVTLNSRKISQLWLGSGAFVNHDCTPNTTMYCLKSKGTICLRAVRDIQESEEITTSYGLNYFELGECECISCTK